MRVLFIADPLERLHPSSDTSLYFLRELFHRSFDCFWCAAPQLSWQNDATYVHSFLVLNAGSREVSPQLGSFKLRSILDFDFIFIRKEPPFDESYLRLCWLLSPYEEKIRFVNKPSILLRHHEKMMPMDALAREYLKQDQIISSCVTESVEEAEFFVKNIKGDHIILKPWLGHGGRDIKLLDRESFLRDPRPHIENTEKWIIQAFENEIFETGDRRVLFMDGKYVGDFVRIPKSGHFVSNLVRGGQAVLRDMNELEKKLTQDLGRFLMDMKIDFAGADYIASRLSEVNITSPTGLGSFEDLCGKNLAKDLIDTLVSEENKK